MILLVLATIPFSIILLAYNTRYYGLKSINAKPKHIDSSLMELSLQRVQKSVNTYLKVKDINLK